MAKMYSVFNRSPYDMRDLGSPGYFPVSAAAHLLNTERTIVGSIINRIAIDVSQNRFMHVDLDKDEYIESIPDSPINRLLRYKPNINQTPAQFIRDIVTTMCTDGVAIVAVTETDNDNRPTQIQCGTALNWFADAVETLLWNNERQILDHVYLRKDDVAIIENPLYTAMNDHGSGIRRLMSKLSQMDAYTANATSGKINAFIGLDYDTSNSIGRSRAISRQELIEEQMDKSKYGIVYHENTEKITFPNKPLDIDINDQVKYLTDQVFGELGVDAKVFRGEAKEEDIKQYRMKTVEPISTAIDEGLTAMFVPFDRFKSERVIHSGRLFAGMTGVNIADAVDKLRRNTILNANEVRKEFGLIKSDEPAANSLTNPNMPAQDQSQMPAMDTGESNPLAGNVFEQENGAQSPASNNIFERNPM